MRALPPCRTDHIQSHRRPGAPWVSLGDNRKGREMIHATSFKGLGYANYGRRHWQVVDLSSGTPSQVGPIYATKAELLSCLPAYAAEFGAVRAS